MGLRDLQLSVMLKMVDKLSGPAKRAGFVNTKLSKGLGQTKSAIKELNQQSKKVEHLQSLNKKMSGVATEATKSKQKLAGLWREFNKAEAAGKSTKRLSQQIAATQNSVTKLTSKHSQLKKQTALTRGELRKAGIDTRNLGNAQNSLGTKTDKLNRKLKRQQNVLNAVRDSGGKLTKLWGKAKGVALGASLALGGAAIPMISTAASFEASMSTVSAITQASGKNFQSLRSQARALGETTSFSASEAAEGMRFLGMAGFNTTQIMSAMPGVLNLAKSGATDLGRASDIASDILSGFGLTAEQMPRVGDVLAKTFTSSNTTLEMLGETMKNVAPIARQFGVSIEETSALAGLLGNVGIKGGQAGTTLRAMLSRLAAPTSAASELLDGLGIKTRDASGNMLSISGIIGDIGKATNKLGSGERLSILKELFGEEPAAGVAELLSQGESKIKAYAKTLQNANGTAARIAKTMGNNTNGSIKEFNSAMEGLSITVGEVFLPVVTDLTKSATSLVRKFSGWAEKNGDLVKTIGAITVGVLGALTVFGALSAGLSVLTSAIGIAKAVFTLFNVVILANPIVAIIMGIAAVAALVITNWDAISTWAAPFWEKIKNVFSSAWQFIKDIFLNWSPLGLIVKHWDAIDNFFGGLPNKFLGYGKNIIEGLGRGIDAKITQVKNSILSLGDALPDWLKDKLDINSPSRVFSDIGGNISDGITGGINAKAKGALNAVKNIGKKLPGALPAALAVGLTTTATAAPIANIKAPQVIQATQSAIKHQVTNTNQVAPITLNLTMNVYPSAGMDEQALAQKIAFEVNKIKQQTAAQARAKIYDEV